jgi:hypothetical protein
MLIYPGICFIPFQFSKNKWRNAEDGTARAAQTSLLACESNCRDFHQELQWLDLLQYLSRTAGRAGTAVSAQAPILRMNA